MRYNKRAGGASAEFGRCSYCGKLGEGYSFNNSNYKEKLIVCLECDKRRCASCGILLSKTRVSSNPRSKLKFGDYRGYFKPGKLCLDCEDILTEKTGELKLK